MRLYQKQQSVTNHKIQKTFSLNCAACDRHLASVIVTSNNSNQQHKFQINCPFCGDKSFITTIDGIGNFLTDLKIKNVTTTNNFTQIEVTC